MEGVSLNERPADFKPIVIQHPFHLISGECSENKPEQIIPKQLSYALKPWELLEELLQNSFNSSIAFSEVFNEFPTLNEDDIFECLIMMCNTYPILEDSTQRMLGTIYSNTRNSTYI